MEESNSDQGDMKAARIPHGLGFKKEMQNKKCKYFSRS
jgi:hypothetical protein